MTFKADDRVRETSDTQGVGTYTLAGAPAGFQAFSSLGANNYCPYFATDDVNWETGIGRVLTAPDRLERTTILSSSNADAAINWGAGTRKIRCGLPALMGYPRYLSKSVAGGAGTTVLTQDEQRRQVLELTGALTGDRTLEVDATPWYWVVYNNTTGDFKLTLKVTGQVGFEIPKGARVTAYCDGADVREGSVASVGSRLSLEGEISPTQIVANQNDYNPTGLNGAAVLRLTTDATLRNITGIAGGAKGRVLVLQQISGAGVVLKNQDVLSTAANRLIIPQGDLTLQVGDSLALWYDINDSRWRLLTLPLNKRPTRTVATAGSGTYTTPPGATYINVRQVGGGGSGSTGGGTPTVGNAGAATTLGALTANGGPGGPTAGAAPVALATASGGDINISGGAGQPTPNATTWAMAGNGGSSFFGGAGSGGGVTTGASAGQAAATNSGSGGGGGAASSSTNVSGGGGYAGAYCEKLITSPSTTYSYAVGAGGASVAGDAFGSASGAGAAGIIIVDEFYD